MYGTVLGWKQGVAQVQLASGPCAGCSSSCPSRAMSQSSVVIAEAPEPLTPGQSVQVSIAVPSANRAVTLALVLPLVGLLTGFFLGYHYYNGAPLPSFVMAVGGAALVYLAVAVVERKRHCRIVVLDTE